MERVEGRLLPRAGIEQGAEHHAEAIAPVAHGQQFEIVLGPRFSPAAGDGLGRLAGGEAALKLVRHNQNTRRHVRAILRKKGLAPA